jgi:hypothetical protein
MCQNGALTELFAARMRQIGAMMELFAAMAELFAAMTEQFARVDVLAPWVKSLKA